MTRYLAFLLKSLFTDRSALFWGIGFMLFWAFMWIYVFTRIEPPLPPREILEYVLRINAAIAYTYLGVLSMSSVAIGLTQYKLFSSYAVAFAARFTKLTPARHLVEDFAAGLVAILTYTSATVAAVVALTYARFGVFVLPERPVEMLGYMLLAGALWYWLSYLLSEVLLAVRKPRSQLLGMLPLMLGFGIYATLWLDPGNIVYLIPVAPLAPLIVSSASGVKPIAGGWILYQPWRQFSGGSGIDPTAAVITSIAYALVFAAGSLMLRRRITGVSREEV